MKWFERLILAAGVLTLGYLLWRFNPGAVWAQVSAVGLGFVAILPFQIFDHMLNALGWLYAFSPEDARSVPYWRLVKVRIAGDGVNYLTPSGTIAGELVRPAMLGDVLTEDLRNASVAVAKFTQAIAQGVFIALGLAFILQWRFDLLAGRQRALALFLVVMMFAFLGGALYLLTAEGGRDGFFWKSTGKFDAIRRQMRLYLRRHPARFILSILCFTGGYAWGSLEALLICHFMGVAITLAAAIAMETLSNLIDSLMFMVPAKIGTQEGGKTAIFHALGYPAGSGLAFGLIRHFRELLWAGMGFGFYAASRMRASAAAKVKSLPEPAPRSAPAGLLSPEDSARI